MSVKRNCGVLLAAVAIAMSVNGCKPSSGRESADTGSVTTYKQGPDNPQKFDFARDCADIPKCRTALHHLPRGFGTERNLPTTTVGDSTSVLIVAYDGARKLDPKKPPKDATLLVHIENHGTANAILWGLQPFPVEYDVTIQANGNDAEWTLWEISDGGTKATWHGKYFDCGHKTKWNISLGDWANCDTGPGGSAASSTPMTASGTAQMSIFGGVGTTFSKYLVMFQDPSDPAWVSCSAGCCTIDRGAQLKD